MLYLVIPVAVFNLCLFGLILLAFIGGLSAILHLQIKEKKLRGLIDSTRNEMREKGYLGNRPSVETSEAGTDR